MNINENTTIKEVLERYPETITIFENYGFKGLNNSEVLKKLDTISIKYALSLKKMDCDEFLTILKNYLTSLNNSVDVTMSSERYMNGDISILGLLPCPIRIPLLENFKKFLEKNKELNIDYQLKAASAGLDWLKAEVLEKDRIENLADIFISAGFDLFFEKSLMGRFKENGIFKDITDIKEYNKDFKELKDPRGEYSILGAVPAIFLVNKNLIGEREIPRTWKDILKPEFKNSIALPIADFDLFNAILVNIYKNYGKEGVKALGESLMVNMHPAQMIGANEPTITIMPYFFSKMAKDKNHILPIWPEDGAIISPIFMLTKKDKEKELKKLAKYFSSKEVGDIFSHQGLFPSTNPEVENFTTDKPIMWVGWEYIYNNDIGKIIKECETIFNEGVNSK